MKKSKLLFLMVPVLAISFGCSKPVDNTVAVGAASMEERAALKVMDGKDFAQQKKDTNQKIVNSQVVDLNLQANEQNEKEISFNDNKVKLLNYSTDSSRSMTFYFGNDAPIKANVYYTGIDADKGVTADYIEADDQSTFVKVYSINKSLNNDGLYAAETYMDVSYKSLLKAYLHEDLEISFKKIVDPSNNGADKYEIASVVYKLKDAKITWVDPSSKPLVEWVSRAESEYKNNEGSSSFEVKVYHNEKTYTFYMNINMMKETSREADLKNSAGTIIGKLYIMENFKLKIKVYNNNNQLEDL